MAQVCASSSFETKHPGRVSRASCLTTRAAAGLSHAQQSSNSNSNSDALLVQLIGLASRDAWVNGERNATGARTSAPLQSPAQQRLGHFNVIQGVVSGEGPRQVASKRWERGVSRKKLLSVFTFAYSSVVWEVNAFKIGSTSSWLLRTSYFVSG